jgi:hypothetical protein
MYPDHKKGDRENVLLREWWILSDGTEIEDTDRFSLSRLSIAMSAGGGSEGREDKVVACYNTHAQTIFDSAIARAGK